MSLRLLIPLQALFLAWPAPAAEVSVTATNDGGVLRVSAEAEFEAGTRETWAVLTDYARLPAFIPGMQESRVIGRGERGPLIEQRGKARLLFLTYSLHVRLQVDEFPYERITSRAVAGSFRRMEGAYVLTPQSEGRMRLTYAGTFVPDFFVPPLIGPLVLRESIERQFGALVDEIVRRRALVRQGEPAS